MSDWNIFQSGAAYIEAPFPSTVCTSVISRGFHWACEIVVFWKFSSSSEIKKSIWIKSTHLLCHLTWKFNIVLSLTHTEAAIKPHVSQTLYNSLWYTQMTGHRGQKEVLCAMLHLLKACEYKFEILVLYLSHFFLLLHHNLEGNIINTTFIRLL